MLLKMLSSANTGYFYVTKKSMKLAAYKLALMKYDPIINRHVLFSEVKLKKKR